MTEPGRLVLLESPFSAPTPELFERNMRYLKACFLDSLHRGEAPFASHALYPQMLHDADEAERQLGMACGFAWGHAAVAVQQWADFHSLPLSERPLHVFYTDLGESSGMAAGRAEFEEVLEVAERKLGDDWEKLLEGRESIQHITLAAPLIAEQILAEAPPPEDPTIVRQLRAALNRGASDVALGKAARKLLGS